MARVGPCSHHPFRPPHVRVSVIPDDPSSRDPGHFDPYRKTMQIDNFQLVEKALTARGLKPDAAEMSLKRIDLSPSKVGLPG